GVWFLNSYGIMLAKAGFFNENLERNRDKMARVDQENAMTSITLEVPDELAARLDQLRDRLPDLLSEALMLSASGNGTTTASSLRYPVLEEMIDFLCSGPTLEQIINYKVSARTQERLAELLDKNRE